MTDEQNKLAEIRARVEKATSGPWQFDGCSVTNWHEQTFEMEWLPNGKGNDGYREVNTNWRNDGELLSSARTDIPYLLALVAAKEERIVELEQSVKDDELAFNTSQDLIGKLEEDLEVAKQELLVAEERIKELEAERDAVKKDAEGWKSDWEMYRRAWIRELGGWIIPKSHEIDSLVLTTRKRCVNPLLGNCGTPHWLGKPINGGKALEQEAHPKDNSCSKWKADESETNPRAESAKAHVASLREALVEAALPLEAIEACVDWELHPEIMTAVKDAVKSIRAALQSTKGAE